MPNDLSDLSDRLSGTGLRLMGHCAEEAGSTILLLGPDEPAFWPIFSNSAEYRDGAADPLDRWSKRLIEGLAHDLGAEALFPSDGPPYPPFQRWALESGRAYLSPVGMLVHADAGLWISFRGALRIARAIPPAPAPTPCDRCAAQPCLTACPVGALGAGGYDVTRCHAFLDTPEGAECMARGFAYESVCRGPS